MLDHAGQRVGGTEPRRLDRHGQFVFAFEQEDARQRDAGSDWACSSAVQLDVSRASTRAGRNTQPLPP